MSSKVFCDLCKKEIKQNAKDFQGLVGKLHFSIVFGECHPEEHHGVNVIEPIDICLPCLLRAINKKAGELLKRKYTRKPKEEVSA